MADTVIRNATIIDGTGAQRFIGDVTVEDGHITEVGSSSSTSAVEVDATGLVLAPGFVDVHTHDDGALLQHPDMEFKISQGCTSVVVGNCGFSAIPAVAGKSTLDLSGVQANWTDLDGYRQNVEKLGPALNAMMLVGHNTIRS
ncbi:MAG TPA: D-aminoacylase, partial [Acidimicrobiaceae bacterium]|nr:D-aminoacylase [Acidimicrobiaceae bacterium]